MFSKILLLAITLLLNSCGNMPLVQSPDVVDAEKTGINFLQWDVPHTNLTMLLPDGWVSEYYQGDISIASDSRNLFYSPAEEFEGVLIHMFVSDGPRAVGPSFDVMKLATEFVADQAIVLQSPVLVESDRRQIVTTLYLNKDTKGKLITYLAGFVEEDQQLTVFLAATPHNSEAIFLPVLTQMLQSIRIKSEL